MNCTWRWVATSVVLVCAGASGRAADDELNEVYRLMYEGKAKEALAKLKTMPESLAMVHALGRAQYTAGQYETGIETLKRSLSMASQPRWMTGWNYYFIGRCYEALGEKAEAKTWLKKALSLSATRNCTNAALRAFKRVAPGEGAPRGQQRRRPDADGKGRLFGRIAPDFRIEGVFGELYSLSRLKGTPVVIQFGTSW